MTEHASDCAVHNEPAYPAGPCSCGAEQAERAAALADDLISRGFYGLGVELGGNDAVEALNLAVRALRLFAEQSATSPAPADLREVVARAFEECEIGFSLQLIRLVDGVSTYLLSTTDGEPDAEFEDQEDAYAELGRRKAKARSDAVLSAIQRDNVIVPREPTGAMIEGIARAIACGEPEGQHMWEATAAYRAMVRAALAANGQAAEPQQPTWEDWWTTPHDRLGGKRPCDDTAGALELLAAIVHGLPA